MLFNKYFLGICILRYSSLDPDPRSAIRDKTAEVWLAGMTFQQGMYFTIELPSSISTAWREF